MIGGRRCRRRLQAGGGSIGAAQQVPDGRGPRDAHTPRLGSPADTIPNVLIGRTIHLRLSCYEVLNLLSYGFILQPKTKYEKLNNYPFDKNTCDENEISFYFTHFILDYLISKRIYFISHFVLQYVLYLFFIKKQNQFYIRSLQVTT